MLELPKGNQATAPGNVLEPEIESAQNPVSLTSQNVQLQSLIDVNISLSPNAEKELEETLELKDMEIQSYDAKDNTSWDIVERTNALPTKEEHRLDQKKKGTYKKIKGRNNAFMDITNTCIVIGAKRTYEQGGESSGTKKMKELTGNNSLAVVANEQHLLD